MAITEVIDYIGWSRDTYHRRLTMCEEPEYDPPLYPIEGEHGQRKLQHDVGEMGALRLFSSKRPACLVRGTAAQEACMVVWGNA
jgi:hypothetical protein